MGVNNRERRKVKQRARTATGRRRDATRTTTPPNVDELAALFVKDGCYGVDSGDWDRLESCALALGDATVGPQWTVAAERALLAATRLSLRTAWTRGWQPADVVRLVRRRLSAEHAGMTVDVIADERTEYATATVAESWDAQLRELNATTWWRPESYAGTYIRELSAEAADFYRRAIEVLHLLILLPPLPVLGPPPGTARRGSLGPELASDRPTDPGIRNRVLALLSKAESTEFPEEAESLTAKAQELMARYSIDYAMLAASSGSTDAPTGVRMAIENPYEDAKAGLLQRIAEANRCQAAFSKHLGFSTVVGYARDLAAVELLFTSLLVQATVAMVAEGARAGRASRTRGFRQSFLVAFAARIGERLRETTDAVSRTVSDESGGALLPVLAAVNHSVKEAAKAMFGDLSSTTMGASDYRGWVAGTTAADLADIAARRGVTASSAV